MMHKLGRFLQFLGLLILPVAISMNANNSIELRDSLMLSGFGILVFFVGWVLQQSAKPP